MTKISKRLLLGAACLVLLAIVIAWVALESEGVQRAIFARVSAALESRLGLTLEAREVRLGVLRGEVELAGVAVRDSSGGAVAGAERAAATVRLGPLLRGRVVVPEVELEGLRVDLARWPASSEDETADPGEEAGPDVEIRSLRIVAGELAGLPLPAAAEGWASGGTITGVALDASLVAGRLAVDVESAALELTRPDAGPLEVEIAGEMEGALAGPYELTDVRLSGRDLDLALSGSLGLSDEQPLRLAVEGWVDAGRLIDERYPARLALGGELDVRAGSGTIDLEAPRIPAELLAGRLEPALSGRLDAADTTFGLEAAVRLGPGGLDRLAGTVGVTWSRPESELAILTLAPKVDASARAGRVPFELRLLPGAPGTRRTAGVLVIPDWQDPGAAAVEEGRVELRLPDLGATLASLRPLAPEAVAAAPAGLGGALELGGSFSGELARPRVDLEADWRPGRDSSLRLSAAGEPVELRGRLRATARNLALGDLAAGLPGIVDGRVDLALDGARRAGSFDLEARGLAAGGMTGLDLATAGELDGDTLRLASLTAEWDGHRVEAAARLELTRDGARVAAERLTVDGVTGELTAEVPGVLLEGLPAALKRPWTTPAARARRVRMAWSLPESDLAGPLALADAELRIATSGDLWIDLERPAGSAGTARVASLDWSAGDRRLSAREPIELMVSGGRLALPGVRLAGPASSADGSLAVDLAEAWRPGDPWVSLAAAAHFEGEGEIGADWLGRALGLDPMAAEALRFKADLSGDRTSLGGALRVSGAGSQIEARGSADLDLESAGEGWAAAVAAVDVGVAGSVASEWAGGLLGLESPDDAPSAGGALALELELAGSLERLRGRVSLDGPGAAWRLGGESPVRLSAPRLEARLDDRELILSELRVELQEQPLVASGAGRLAAGRLDVERLDIAFAGIESRWSASLPMGDAPAAGEEELSAAWSIAESDLEPALELFGLIRPGDRLRAGSSGSVRMDPSNPASAEGQAEISGFDWLSAGRRATSNGPIRMRLEDGRLTLGPVELVSQEQLFELAGQAELARSWTPESGVAGLIDHLELGGSGTLLTSLLNPFLGGASAEGYLDIDLEVAGPPSGLRGRVKLAGAETTLTWARPYATRISEPSLELSFEPGGVASLEGSLRLNEGRVALSGDASGEGPLALDVEITGVRYRLDYGLLALFNGDLTLLRSTTGAWGLGGTIELENGVLTRDIDVDLDFVLALLAPIDLTSTEASPLEAVALDLDLTTVEGVRVKNNAADILVRWDPVRIGGTLAAPVPDGRFEIDSGGRVRAFGQTVRIDSASIDYPGVADLPATLDFDITSSLEDPSIAGLSGEDPFASSRDASAAEADRVAAAAAGLGAFYGERIATRLTGGLTGATVTLQPLLIFGEADPGARLTVTQDVSPQVSLAASIDLRQAEAQTYLLDVHRLDALPGLNAQVFTTDAASEGLALRQRVLLGPGGAARSPGPKIRRIRYQLPPEVSKRRTKRALGLRKGDRLEDGAAFAAEVEIVESLRRRGYSDARATVAVEPVSTAAADGVELVVSARPGPHASFFFEGEKLPKALRRPVVDLYRPDYYESVALEEMAAETRRALRSLGYLEPEVGVTVEPVDPERPDGDRVVTVAMSGGRRVELERVSFVPLPPDEAAVLETRFSRPVRRIELAAGVPDADRRVEETLRYLGYGDPRVVSRSLSENGRQLEVVVEAGERPRIARVAVAGVDPEEAERLAGLIDLEPGDPVRSDRVASAAVALREDLESRGYMDARVEPRVEPVEAAEERLSEVRFEVDPGTLYFVGEVAFTGLASTRERFARKVADLPPQTDVSQETVLEARRRLRETQLFETVTPEVVRAPGGVVRVDFGVRERKRFELAYGARWDSEEDLGLLAEAIDRNVLGQGWTLGLRAQWAENDQSLRLFAGLPRLFGERSSLAFFTAVREETEDGVLERFGNEVGFNRTTETLENTLQLSYELTRRLTARLYGRLTESRERTVIDFRNTLPFDVRLTRAVLGSQVLYDSRRGEVLFTDGLLATADLSLSDESFGSDFNYVRLFGQVNYYRELLRQSKRPLVWAQSLRIGLAEAFEGELIRQDRFFAGGEFSVRGYLTESLGPRETLFVGNVPVVSTAAGGNALLVLNQELRWRFAERFTGVGFVDVGNVWAERSDFGSDLFTSIGIGLRAGTPVGILRLDLAHPLDGRPFDPEYKVYVGFGSTF